MELFDSDSDRGQVGIGMLIVFIAIVLVAAIAAGVLINTAGLLQDTAADTGDETQSEVSDRIIVQNAFAGVDSDDELEGNVSVTVRPAAGAGDINLADATIEFLNPSAGESGVITSDDFDIQDEQGVEDGILGDEDDRATIEVNATEQFGGGAPLGESDEVEVTFVTAGGGETFATF